MKAFQRAEKLPKPKLGAMFDDVWGVSKGEKVPEVIVSLNPFLLFRCQRATLFLPCRRAEEDAQNDRLLTEICYD